MLTGLSGFLRAKSLLSLLLFPLYGNTCLLQFGILTHLEQNKYASEVGQHLSNLGLFADVDVSPETLKKKIRNGEIAQYNFILGKL